MRNSREAFGLGGWLVTVMAAAAALGGCDGKQVIVSRYPSFWTDQTDIRVIAMAPLADPQSTPGAGAAVADRIAAAVAASGGYQVLGRQTVANRLSAEQFEALRNRDAQAIAAMQDELAAQAVLVGQVTRYSWSQSREQRIKTIPQYGFDAHGNYAVRSYHNEPFWWTRYTAVVDARLDLITLTDGKILHSLAMTGTYASEGEDPPVDGAGAMNNAMQALARQAAAELNIVRRQIEIDSDVLRTAVDLRGDEWDFAKSFPADAAKMYVVVTLPGEADRNRFRLEFVRKGRDEALAERRIIWDRRYRTFGWDFSPREITAQAGPGTYTVRLYSGGELLAKRDVKFR